MATNPDNPRGEYRKQPLAERLDALSIPEPNSGCVLWIGYLNPDGYARVTISIYGEKQRTRLAHVVAYELKHGAVTDGLELDHKCRTTCCINPDHLEPVTHRVNVLRSSSLTAQRARQTHCKNGHELAGDNLYVDPKGRRKCRTCVSTYRASYAKGAPN